LEDETNKFNLTKKQIPFKKNLKLTKKKKNLEATLVILKES
jgi:hypothetical protein